MKTRNEIEIEAKAAELNMARLAEQKKSAQEQNFSQRTLDSIEINMQRIAGRMDILAWILD